MSADRPTCATCASSADAREVERAHGAWSAAMAAVANGLEADTALQAGTTVKVAMVEAYMPRGGSR